MNKTRPITWNAKDKDGRKVFIPHIIDLKAKAEFYFDLGPYKTAISKGDVLYNIVFELFDFDY